MSAQLINDVATDVWEDGRKGWLGDATQVPSVACSEPALDQTLELKAQGARVQCEEWRSPR